MLDRLADEEVARSRSGASLAHGEGEGANAVASPAAPVRQRSEPLILKPGALITREWKSRIERVMVVKDGFAWNGETYGSLSAVAFAITGTKWNGHRFFGVRPQDRIASPAIDKDLKRGKIAIQASAPMRTSGEGSHRSSRTGRHSKGDDVDVCDVDVEDGVAANREGSEERASEAV